MSSDPYPTTDRALPAAKLGRSVILTKFDHSGKLGPRITASTDHASRPASYGFQHALGIPGNHARAAKLAAYAWFTGSGQVELTGANIKPGVYAWIVHAPAEHAATLPPTR